MPKTNSWLLGGATLVLCAGAGLAVAQPRPDDQGRAGMRPAAGMFRHPPARAMMMQGGDRTAHLRTLLQLRADQEPALAAFVAATARPEPRDQPARFDQ